MTRKLLVLTCVLLGAAIVVYFIRPAPSDGFWGYTFERLEIDSRVVRFSYRNEDQKLTVTRTGKVENEIARSMIDEQLYMFNALFEKQRVGYKGQHTEFVECDPDYKPVYHVLPIQGGELRFFSGYSNDRFIPGACDADSVSYRVLTGFLYCEATGYLFEIEHHYPLASDDPILVARLTCSVRQ